MTDKIEELSAFPPNSNPYHHDLFNMGQDFSKEWHMMFKNHAMESAEWVIFIHKPTGRRFKIHLSKLVEAEQGREHGNGRTKPYDDRRDDFLRTRPPQD